MKAAKKIKTHPFTIYLLQKDFDASKALKEKELKKPELLTASNLPANSKLYLFDKSHHSPWWKEYFEIDKDLVELHNNAILFINIKDRCFALTFGNARHHLDDNAYEYNFGFIVTLNCVDPDKLKSTDTFEPGGSKRKRTQIPNAGDLTFFDFNENNTIIKSLTGKVKDSYKELITNVSGDTSLHVRKKIESKKLPEFLENLLDLYNSKNYIDNFPNIQKINPIKDPNFINQLNEKLIEALCNKHENLELTIPDIIDYKINYIYKISNSKTEIQYEEIELENYHDYLKQANEEIDTLDLTKIKNTHKIYLFDEDSNKKSSPYSIYKCCVFDTKLNENDQDSYYLSGGIWYKIDLNFIRSIDKYLDSEKFNIEIDFPAFDHRDENGRYSEKIYNKTVAELNSNRILMDSNDISLKGQKQVEPCDIWEIQDNKYKFFHVKRNIRSATLSHLFNQGYTSANLLVMNNECRQKFSELIPKEFFETHNLNLEDRSNYQVIYVIITKKKIKNRSINLPIFSRIGLKRVLEDLETMNVKGYYCFVRDASER